MRFRKPKVSRYERRMFPPSLDELVPQDDPVRELWTILQSIDWGPWEAKQQAEEQDSEEPLVHPMLLAGVIMLGSLIGFLSDRAIADISRDWLSMQWLLEGITVDEPSISRFRRQFREELKHLVRYVIMKARKEHFPNLRAWVNTALQDLAIEIERDIVAPLPEERRLEMLVESIASGTWVVENADEQERPDDSV